MADRRSVLQAAEKLVARGKLEAAIKQYRKALAESPDDTGTLNRLGDLYARLDRVDDAVKMFSTAADHFAREGFFVKAIAIYKKIIRLDPTRIAVYETLADLYHRQGLVNEARSQYQVVADYYKQSGEQGLVVGVFEKMVELEPNNPSVRLKLAEIYCTDGRIPEAMEQYNSIAGFMLEHGKQDEALKVFLGAFELRPDDLGFLTDVIVDLKDRDEEPLARRLLERAIERNPDAERVAELVEFSEGDVPERRGSRASEEQSSEQLAKPEAGPEPKLEPVAQSAPVEVEEAEPEAVVIEIDEAPLEAAIAEAAGAVTDEELEPSGLDVGEGVGSEEVGEVASEVHELDSAEPESATETGEFEIDLDPLDEKLAPVAKQEPEPVQPEPVQSKPKAPATLVDEELSLADRAAELVTEANVLSSYGLESKAVDLLDEALTMAPDSIDAAELLMHLHKQAGRSSLVVQTAMGFFKNGVLPVRVSELLKDWEYQVDADGIRPPEGEVEEVVAEASIDLEAAAPKAERLDWLDEKSEAAPAEDPDTLFGDESDFFDLAAELEEELLAEEAKLGEDLMPQVEEQSIEEIVEGFKQGVAETLSTEDFDTHFNLGIAYREMGLVDEAIGEFQLAAKSEQYLVDCCSLLGTSFLEKGFPDLAIKWFERGLKAPKVSDEEKLGLLYELGNLYLTTGDRDTAKDTFVEIYGANSNYRDVVAKLEELRQA